MRLALNMANMAKEGFSCTAIEKTQQQIKKPHAEVGEKKMRSVVFPGHNKVRTAIDIHPAMIRDTQTDGCFFRQNGTSKNPQTRWSHKATGAPSPGAAPPRPGTPPAPPDDSEGNQSAETEGEPPGYVYIHTPLPST